MPMTRIRTITLAAAIAVSAQLVADEMDFPEILDAGIPGAPKLGQPFLVTGGSNPILTEKHGLAAPALWDWNGDGKRDLLVGEFETNSGESFPMGADGSTIRVHLNVGTDADPKFTDEFEWARDTEGTIMEVPQWCCIGFTPQFVELDDDGHLDMITGQYHPGEVTWFRGVDDGFQPGVKLPQEGDPTVNGQPMMGNYDGEPGDIGTFHYWVYSSASFGDFDDDGDYDLIVGGSTKGRPSASPLAVAEMSREARSRRRLPNSTVLGPSPVGRRATARIRAHSSSGSKGLTT
jgi:hypothetical protein